jgi:hypothetical protein
LGFQFKITVIGHLRFTFEAGDPVGIQGEQLRQDLQRDGAIQPGVLCAIDLAHAAGTERTDDLVRTKRRSDRQGHVPTESIS